MDEKTKVECLRLAKLAWPWTGSIVEDCGDPLEIYIGDGECKVFHPYEEDSEGLKLQHPDSKRAAEAMLAALRVLAGEPVDLALALDIRRSECGRFIVLDMGSHEARLGRDEAVRLLAVLYGLVARLPSDGEGE